VGHIEGEKSRYRGGGQFRTFHATMECILGCC